MKNTLLLLALVAISNLALAQNAWFSVYSDSTKLAIDGNTITSKFIKDVNKIDPKLIWDVKTIVHTTPYLIYLNSKGKQKIANLPLWDQVIPDQQKFFYEVAGGEANGKLAFGLFFNGFYLPHELGHALQDIIKGDLEGSYENEYFANVVSMLWWRKNGREKELRSCYENAKTMFGKLPNPVPTGMSTEDFFRKNYEKAGADPYVYGYMQFKQFITIYEDQTLPNFDTFVKNYITKK